MARKPLTISVDPEVLNKFKKHCKERDISISRRLERYMKMEIGEKVEGVETRLKREIYVK